MGIKVHNWDEIRDEYDEFILEWMADIYTYMQWKYAYPSADIVAVIKPDELYDKYYPLHETSVEAGAERLRKIYL